MSNKVGTWNILISLEVCRRDQYFSGNKCLEKEAKVIFIIFYSVFVNDIFNEFVLSSSVVYGKNKSLTN